LLYSGKRLLEEHALSFPRPLWVSSKFASLLLCVLVLSRPAPAQDCDKNAAIKDSRPSNPQLLLLGLELGAIDYFLGVTLHEGSHVAAVKALGGRVSDFSILPSRASNGTFRFGNTKWTSSRRCPISYTDPEGQFHQGERWCDLNSGEKAFVYIAPKITDALILGSYSLALEKGWLDDNKILKLNATVLATGALVDWGKDIFAINEKRDIPGFYNAIGAESELERYPFRLFHAATTAAFAVEVGRGYYSLFTNDSPPRPIKKPAPKTERHPVINPSFVGVGGTF
jgi:hypothetical protein